MSLESCDCATCRRYRKERDAKTATVSGSPELTGCATELAGLKKCMERGFKALHLEVAPSVANDLRNTVYAVINHLEGNK